MAKSSSKWIFIILSVCGILTSLLPWSRISMGSIPPGDLPDVVYYGYEADGLFGIACFLGIILTCVFTTVNKPLTKKQSLIVLILSSVALVACILSIVLIAINIGKSGAVAQVDFGALLMSLTSFILLVFSIYTTKKA